MTANKDPRPDPTTCYFGPNCPQCLDAQGRWDASLIYPFVAPTGSQDPINAPAHYVDGRKFEPLSVIEDWQLGYHLGQVVKYVSRAGRKGDAVEDLQKAEFYLRREIERLKAK